MLSSIYKMLLRGHKKCGLKYTKINFAPLDVIIREKFGVFQKPFQYADNNQFQE